jgi:hypothetical protein
VDPQLDHSLQFSYDGSRHWAEGLEKGLNTLEPYGGGYVDLDDYEREKLFSHRNIQVVLRD